MIQLKAGDGAALRRSLYSRAAWLAVFTVLYNLAEGAFSVYFGLEDETLALLGFGLDSFVEVISGAGILHMVLRLGHGGAEGSPDRFEATALRVTGGAFYLLSSGLVITALFAVAGRHAPETTFWGIVVSLVSIATMWVLIKMKERVGRALGSAAVLADASCTRACLYLSVVLLFASAGYELTGLRGLDAAGATFIAVLAFREGREAFEKARSGRCSCHGPCGTEGDSG